MKTTADHRNVVDLSLQEKNPFADRTPLVGLERRPVYAPGRTENSAEPVDNMHVGLMFAPADSDSVRAKNTF